MYFLRQIMNKKELSIFSNFIKASPNPVTQEQILDELKRHPSLERYHVDPVVKLKIETIINALVQLNLKEIGEQLDIRQLAIAAKKAGLNENQITDALNRLTPKILTQENILAAFEKVRSEGK